jgi:hypothetical protein
MQSNRRASSGATSRGNFYRSVIKRLCKVAEIPAANGTGVYARFAAGLIKK